MGGRLIAEGTSTALDPAVLWERRYAGMALQVVGLKLFCQAKGDLLGLRLVGEYCLEKVSLGFGLEESGNT